MELITELPRGGGLDDGNHGDSRRLVGWKEDVEHRKIRSLCPSFARTNIGAKCNQTVDFDDRAAIVPKGNRDVWRDDIDSANVDIDDGGSLNSDLAVIWMGGIEAGDIGAAIGSTQPPQATSRPRVGTDSSESSWAARTSVVTVSIE